MLDLVHRDHVLLESEDVRVTQFREAERRLWDRYDPSTEDRTISLDNSGRGVRC